MDAIRRVSEAAMRRSLIVSTALCALSFGCAPTNPGLTIDGVLVPSDTCGYTTSSAFLVEGVLDTNPDVPMSSRPAGVRYVAILRVANHLINTGNRVYPFQADTSVITLEAAEIEVLNTDGTSFSFGGLPNPFRVTATGTIGSTTSNEPELGITTIEAIPAQYGAALAGIASGTIIVSIRVIGVTSGGSALISGRSLVPIRLCDGCLFQCVLDDMMMPIEAPSCLPGQDATSLTCG
jgi:hypothetical protein